MRAHDSRARAEAGTGGSGHALTRARHSTVGAKLCSTVTCMYVVKSSTVESSRRTVRSALCEAPARTSAEEARRFVTSVYLHFSHCRRGADSGADETTNTHHRPWHSPIRRSRAASHRSARGSAGDSGRPGCDTNVVPSHAVEMRPMIGHGHRDAVAR